MTLSRTVWGAALLVLCSCGPTDGAKVVAEEIGAVAADGGLVPDRQEHVAAIRHNVYGLVDVAATAELEFEPPPRSFTELRELFSANQIAVWCSGAAYTLQQAYQDAGYQSWTLHYGFYDEEMLNHVTTLVRVGDEIYLQDAYLNFDYPTPFFDVVEQIANGRVPTPRVGGGLRDVQVPEATLTSSWAVAPGSDCSPLESKTSTMLCRSEANLSLFEERFMTSTGRSSLDRLEELGYPRDISSLLLFPRAVFDGKRYSEDFNHPILRRLATIAAQREIIEPLN